MPKASGEERSSRVAKRSRRYRAEAKALGLRIRQLRQDRSWTLDRASEATHLDLKHLQKVESGVLNVTLVTLVRIAQGYGVEVGELFAGGGGAVPAATKRRGSVK